MSRTLSALNYRKRETVTINNLKDILLGVCKYSMQSGFFRTLFIDLCISEIFPDERRISLDRYK